MRSRDRPVCRTLRFATPADVAVTTVDGGTVWDAPACREAWFAHRIELDHPPDRLDDGFARW
ncbi:MAG: hypothetical protein ABMB14_40445, partial [Myxococcota bacterium]